MKRACLLAVALAACGEESVEPSGPTWHADVRPIVETSCLSCHVDGGIAPFSLERFEDAAIYREMIAYAVENRIMPPWPPADGCNEYVGNRSLTQSEIDTVVAWASTGGTEGDPASYRAPRAAPSGLSRVDATVELPEPYLPNPIGDTSDDYRCFLLDWPYEEKRYVTGFAARPGEPSVVHHVIAFLARPDEVDVYQALDDAEPGAGYTCFGGPGLPFTEGVPAWVGAWVPGMTDTDLPAGVGLGIEPGSKIVLQVHYNTASGERPDQTALDFKIDEAVDREAMILPWANPSWLAGNMPIAAGDRDASHDVSFDATVALAAGLIEGPVPGNQPFEIHAAALHMHTRGSSARIQVDKANGESACLLDIPRWDFHWQGVYPLTRPVRYEPGDNLTLRCTWDNRGGPELNWGEGTGDEMCLGVLLISEVSAR